MIVPLAQISSSQSSPIPSAQDWGTRLFDDGLHFTADGNQVVFDKVIETIRKEYPSLAFENLPLHFPHWDSVDYQDPEKSLGIGAEWRK